MNFANHAYQDVLNAWRNRSDLPNRAEADNMKFEERVSTDRVRAFENVLGPVVDPGDLRRRQIDYVLTYVEVDADVPDTFRESLYPAEVSSGELDPYQRIVRVEDLSRPLLQFGITYDELDSAFLNKNYALLDKFLDSWNSIRDLRPAFAAWRDELQIELEAEDWPDLLRDRLGLAHYTCVAGPTPVALMEYRVRDVIAAGSWLPSFRFNDGDGRGSRDSSGWLA